MKLSIQKNSGLTLIEVLIALAILAIALTAIIKTSGQNIKNTVYLENKVIAAWVGNNVINEARVGVVQIPVAPGDYSVDTEMLGRIWTVHAVAENTPNLHIREVIVDVYPQGSKNRLAHLVGYLYAM